jgi:hypothetical protein
VGCYNNMSLKVCFQDGVPHHTHVLCSLP